MSSPVIFHQQRQAAVIPRSLPQTGEDEQQELRDKTGAVSAGEPQRTGIWTNRPSLTLFFFDN